MAAKLEDIKLVPNHNVSFPFVNEKIKSLLIFGNTINFFGFVNNSCQLDLMTMNKNDQIHLLWLAQRVKEKTKILIIGEKEEIEYYQRLFNFMKLAWYLNCKVKYELTTNEKPIEYITILNKYTKEQNMTWDYIVGNPPFGSVGGDTLHLKCINKVYNNFNKQMIVIMPYGFVTKDNSKFIKYQIKFQPKLQYVKEIDSKNFEGTKMPSVAIYEFSNNETKTTTIEDLSRNKTEKSDLTNISQFTEYENNILFYLNKFNQQQGISCGGHDHCTKKSLNKQGIFDEVLIQKLINNTIIEHCKHVPTNKIFLLVNSANGKMNGTFISSKAGLIFNTNTDLINLLVDRQNSTYSNVLVFDRIKSAQNCKEALKRPLLRFTCYKTQNDQNMTLKRVYKYVPAINWEDERCLTDEGLLEMCGCPKDKAKEYAEYVKNYVEERDKEIKNRKNKK